MGKNVTDLGVIFDIDGVLVDSYRAHYESWRILAAEQGLEYSQEQFAATFGRTSRDILTSHWPVKLSPQQVKASDEHKEELYRQIVREIFPTMPGCAQLVKSLYDDGFKLAVGSSAPPANVEVSLDGLEIRKFISAAVNGSDVQRGKPHPQVFLLAAQRLRLPPENCAVIEDARAGVEAAINGGMIVIALTGTSTREELAEADLVVAHLDELTPQRIKELLQTA